MGSVYFIIDDCDFIKMKFDDIKDGEIVVRFEASPISDTVTYIFDVKVGDRLEFLTKTTDDMKIGEHHDIAKHKLRSLKLNNLMNT